MSVTTEERWRQEVTMSQERTSEVTTNRTRPTAARLKFGVILLTPELAQEFLDRNADYNRKQSQGHVDLLAADIASGRWALNGESIKFNVQGEMVDGQHRCLAVIKAGKAVWVAIVEGLDDPKGYATIDVGKQKRTADHLGAQGEKHARVLETMLRYVVAYQTTCGAAIRVYPESTKPERMEVFQRGASSFRESAEFAVLHAKNFLGGGLVAFVHYVLKAVDAAGADEFLSSLMEGANLPDDSLILRLRERLVQDRASKRGRLPAQEVAYLIFRAWNAWRKHEPLARLTLPKGSGETGARGVLHLPEPV